MTRFPLITAILAMGMFGCDAVWNAANRGTAEADLRAIFEKVGVPIQVQRCRMIGTTRDAICGLSASPDEIRRAVASLGMQPVTPNRGLPATAPELCAEAGRFAAGEPVMAYGAAGRPAILMLGHGGAFESLYLFYDERTGHGCARIAYSYG
jgi:hypothetical protein